MHNEIWSRAFSAPEEGRCPPLCFALYLYTRMHILSYHHPL